MNLGEIKAILTGGNIRLTKSLGQNFLHDANQLDRIVAAGEIRPGEKVLEIGPGLGALTHRLLASDAQVRALEKDQRLYNFLKARYATDRRLELIHTDALAYLVEGQADWSGWKMVSNLPYSVGSPILVELAKGAAGVPERMVVTVQLEVAKRLVAKPGESDYGILSLLIQARYESGGWFKIPAACFFPAPAVDSACVTLRRRPKLLLNPNEFPAFERIVKRGFSQRRKMMLKLLKMDWPAPALEAAFSQLRLSPGARAETVSLEQYVQLARLVADTPKEP